MDKNSMPYVMPVKVFLFERPITVTSFFDKDHMRLIDIREMSFDPFLAELQTFSFDTDLYLSMLQIDDEQTLIEYFKANPHLLLFDSSNLPRYLNSTEYMTGNQYSKLGLKLLNIFKTYMSVLNLLPKKASLDWDTLNKLYLETTVLSYLSYGQKFFDYMQQEFDSAVFSVLGSVSDDVTPLMEIKYLRNKKIIVGVNGSISEELKHEIHMKYVHNYINFHENLIQETVQREASHFIPRFDLNTMSICLYCDTIINAMYAMLLLSINNNDTYRKCAHKGCEKYFIVDKSHPQTRCAEHMKVRQTRRNNEAARKARGNKESLLKQKERQALAISNAEVAYQETNDIDAFIKFWEELWASKKGLMSQNNDDAFRLADLYDEVGRYEDALIFVRKIGKEKCFSERAKEYEEPLLKKIKKYSGKVY